MFPEFNFAAAIGADSFVCELLLEALAGTPLGNKTDKEGTPIQQTSSCGAEPTSAFEAPLGMVTGGAKRRPRGPVKLLAPVS